jgi:hypothetical protein
MGSRCPQSLRFLHVRYASFLLQNVLCLGFCLVACGTRFGSHTLCTLCCLVDVLCHAPSPSPPPLPAGTGIPGTTATAHGVSTIVPLLAEELSAVSEHASALVDPEDRAESDAEAGSPSPGPMVPATEPEGLPGTPRVPLAGPTSVDSQAGMAPPPALSPAGHPWHLQPVGVVGGMCVGLINVTCNPGCVGGGVGVGGWVDG